MDKNEERNMKVTTWEEIMKPVNKKAHVKLKELSDLEAKRPHTQLWRPHCSIILHNIPRDRPGAWR